MLLCYDVGVEPSALEDPSFNSLLQLASSPSDQVCGVVGLGLGWGGGRMQRCVCSGGGGDGAQRGVGGDGGAALSGRG